jgi:hypothetical protein
METEGIADNEALKNWTFADVETFLKLYRFHPKDFAKIAAGMENKSTKECVFFYYHLNRENLPLAIRSSRRRPPEVTMTTPVKNKNGKQNQAQTFICNFMTPLIITLNCFGAGLA